MKINLKGNKGASNSIVIMLLVCILILIFLLFYFIKNPIITVAKIKELETPLANTIETEKQPLANITTIETTKTYTSKDLKGIYKFSEILKIEEDYEPECFYNLYLNDDGTFWYEYGVDTPSGYYGNYFIEGNVITLNTLFNHGSDAGLHLENKTIKLKINSDGTITDFNDYGLKTTTQNINLKRTSNELEENETLINKLKITIDAQKEGEYLFD